MPWHCAHANWTKSCPPAATVSLTAVCWLGVVSETVTVLVTVFVLPQAVAIPVTKTPAAATAPIVRSERVRNTRRGYNGPPAFPSAMAFSSIGGMRRVRPRDLRLDLVAPPLERLVVFWMQRSDRGWSMLRTRTRYPFVQWDGSRSSLVGYSLRRVPRDEATRSGRTTRELTPERMS